MTDPNAGPRFRISALVPLAPRRAHATSGAPPVRAYVADGNAVDSLLTQIGVAVKLEVADPLGPPGQAMRVDLRISEMRSFRPDAIVEQIAPLRALQSVRGLLRDLGRKNAGHDESLTELKRVLPVPGWAEALSSGITAGSSGARPSTPAPAAGSKGSAIDSLLDQVEVGGGKPSDGGAAPSAEPSPKAGQFSSLIASVAKGGVTSSRTGPANQATDRAERAFKALLGAILDHPEMRRLERVWRSVRFLLGQAAGSNADVEVIPVDDESLGQALAFLAERPAEVAPPPDLLLLDEEAELTEAGLRRLEAAGDLAAQLRSPLLVTGRAADLVEGDEVTRALQEVGKAEWASWVAVAYNGGLVRSPYTAESARVRDPRFEQEADAAGARVFASAPYVIAALCARSFKESGWPSAIVGPEAGVMGGFDVHTANAQSAALATEKLVSVEACKKQARRGLLTLTSVPNRDMAVCLLAPTLAAAADPHAPTLCDQLFVARLVATVLQLGSAIPEGTDPRAAEEVASITLAELFPTQGSSIPTFEAKVKDGVLQVSVNPRRFAGTSIGEITLDAPLEG